ncbi:MAG TPA: hypothetical protein VK760_16215, partial [Candidatus Acidoferrales bacterium]|nr:hypothetical protein [Candidatus Acidoferrales bacterium]
MNRRWLTLSAGLVALIVAACSANTNVAPTVGTQDAKSTSAATNDAAKQGTVWIDTYRIRAGASHIAPHTVTTASPPIDTSGFATSLAEAPYESDSGAIWFTDRGSSSPGIGAYDTVTNTVHFHTPPPAVVGFPTDIAVVDGYVYAGVDPTGTSSPTQVAWGYKAGVTPPTKETPALAEFGVGSIVSNAVEKVWMASNNGTFVNLDVTTNASAISSPTSGPTLSCTKFSLAYLNNNSAGDPELICPQLSTLENVLGIYDITTKTTSTKTLPGGTTAGDIALDASAGTDGYTWVAQYRPRTGSPALSVMQLDNSNAIAHQYLDLSLLQSAAISDRAGTVWAVANKGSNAATAIYFEPCTDGTWMPITIAYAGDGPSTGGGIITATDGSAWFIDPNNGVLVHVSKPTG